MRAITIRQPWAWAIIHAGKNVENRSRNIAGAYRGPVAIHAGLQTDDTAYHDDMIQAALGMFDDSWELDEQISHTGVFIGVVDLVDVHNFGSHGCSSRWAQRDAVHLVFRNPRMLPHPIPCRGRLGLWTPPAEIAAQLEVAA